MIGKNGPKKTIRNMKFLGHAVGAGVVGIIATALTLEAGNSLRMAAEIGGVLWLGGQVPDLDIASIPAKWFGRLGFLAAGLLFGYGFLAREHGAIAISAVIGLMALLLMAIQHRGPLHKYWLPAACVFMSLFQGNSLMMAFGLGIIVHLMLDKIFPWQFRGWWL